MKSLDYFSISLIDDPIIITPTSIYRRLYDKIQENQPIIFTFTTYLFNTDTSFNRSHSLPKN